MSCMSSNLSWNLSCNLSCNLSLDWKSLFFYLFFFFWFFFCFFLDSVLGFFLTLLAKLFFKIFSHLLLFLELLLDSSIRWRELGGTPACQNYMIKAPCISAQIKPKSTSSFSALWSNMWYYNRRILLAFDVLNYLMQKRGFNHWNLTFVCAFSHKEFLFLNALKNFLSLRRLGKKIRILGMRRPKPKP